MSQFCASCGAMHVDGASHCAQCGAAATVPATVSSPTPNAQIPAVPAASHLPPGGPLPTPGPAPQPTSNTALVIAVAVLSTLVVVGLVALVVSTRSQDDGAATDAGPAAAITTTTEAPTATTTMPATSITAATTAAPPTTVAVAGPGDVLEQPAGQLCRDLESKGYSYSASVAYWRFHGQPNRMDADRNGIPCETVYPRSDVTAYWGTTVNPDYQGVPTGLFCKDLKARGYSYAEAAAYWFATGAPDNMDADKNGIPCETVYPASEVNAYWYG